MIKNVQGLVVVLLGRAGCQYKNGRISTRTASQKLSIGASESSHRNASFCKIAWYIGSEPQNRLIYRVWTTIRLIRNVSEWLVVVWRVTNPPPRKESLHNHPLVVKCNWKLGQNIFNHMPGLLRQRRGAEHFVSCVLLNSISGLYKQIHIISSHVMCNVLQGVSLPYKREIWRRRSPHESLPITPVRYHLVLVLFSRPISTYVCLLLGEQKASRVAHVNILTPACD